MTIKMDDASVNAMLNALETLWGTGIKWEVWSGAIPADESTAPAGTCLVRGTAPSDYFNAASAGVMTKLGTWSQAAIATGVATFLRLTTSAGVSKFQCSLTATGGGGDATIDNTNINTGQVTTVTSLGLTGPHL